MSDTWKPHGLQPTRILLHGIFQARVLEWFAIVFSNFHKSMKKEIVLLIPTNMREVFTNILVFLNFCYGVLHVCVCVCVHTCRLGLYFSTAFKE